MSFRGSRHGDNDTLIGGLGNDTLDGQTLDGGSGVDTLIYAGSAPY